jgi:hypothetical protein
MKIFMFLLFSTQAHATADGPDYYMVRNLQEGYFLNVRAEADIKSKVVGTLAHDAKYIPNNGCVGGATFEEYQRGELGKPRWCRIRYKGIDGWSSGNYLGEGPNPPHGN